MIRGLLSLWRDLYQVAELRRGELRLRVFQLHRVLDDDVKAGDPVGIKRPLREEFIARLPRLGFGDIEPFGEGAERRRVRIQGVDRVAISLHIAFENRLAAL